MCRFASPLLRPSAPRSAFTDSAFAALRQARPRLAFAVPHSSQRCRCESLPCSNAPCLCSSSQCFALPSRCLTTPSHAFVMLRASSPRRRHAAPRRRHAAHCDTSLCLSLAKPSVALAMLRRAMLRLCHAPPCSAFAAPRITLPSLRLAILLDATPLRVEAQRSLALPLRREASPCYAIA